MSLSNDMSMVVHSLQSAGNTRRLALDGIRKETARYLASANVSRRRMVAAQRALRTEALRSTHLATAMILGAANELVDEFHTQRLARTIELKHALSVGAKHLRTQTRKWLHTASALRKRQSAQNRKDRLARRTSLRIEVAAMARRYREFLGSLTKDRSAAAGKWRTHPVGAQPAVHSNGAHHHAAVLTHPQSTAAQPHKTKAAKRNTPDIEAGKPPVETPAHEHEHS